MAKYSVARRLGKILHEMEQWRGSFRTRQMPLSSITKDDGSDVLVTEVASDASDALNLSETNDSQLGDMSVISDSTTVELTNLPPRLAVPSASAGASFELAMNAAERVGEAQDVADAALEAAAQSERTALGLARRYSETEPEPPEGGWPVGAEWVQSFDGVPRYVWVWDGTGWNRAQTLADEILIPGEDGAIRLGDSMVSAPNMAAGALDAFTVNALQMYGGYIEAPTIASSDKLGSGANALNDPTFVSAIDEAWVASGHLGDAAATQIDLIKWNQTWVQTRVLADPTTWKNDGSVAARLHIRPLARRVGTLLFANFGFVPKGTRTINNPFTFTNTGPYDGHNGGELDPSLKAVTAPPAALPGVSRTTYLTNTAVVPVVSGERWNARITFTPVPTAQAQFISGISVEIVDDSTGVVVWSRPLLPDEVRGGMLNAWWDCDFTGNVRYRIKAVYTAGGGIPPQRVIDQGSWAGKWPMAGQGVGGTWVAPSGMYLPYGGYPSTWQTTPHLWDGRIGINIDVRNAMFAKVEPRQGWRITEDGGIELFNSFGAKTGNIDGENNFLAGRFATAESGMRWEVQGERVAFFDAAGLLVGGMRRAGSGIQIFGPISYQGDTDWITIPLLSEFEIMAGVTPRYRVINGTLYLRGRVRRKTGADLGTAYTSVTPDGVIPNLAGVRDSAGSARSVPGSGVNDEGLVRITDNGAIQCAARTGIAHSFLTADWVIG